jgi:hypothetical protein
LAIGAVAKMGLFVFLLENSFSIHFLPKKPRKPPKNLVKPIHSLQKHKKLVQNPKPKIFLSLDMFFMCFQDKRTLNHNPLHHMKSFDTTINHVDDLNLLQHQLSFSKPDFSNPLSDIHKKKRPENKGK